MGSRGAAVHDLRDEVAQSLTVTDIRPVTGFPDCALKETSAVEIADLRSGPIDLATDRVRAPDQVAFGIDLGIGGDYEGRVTLHIAMHDRCTSSWRRTYARFQFER